VQPYAFECAAAEDDAEQRTPAAGCTATAASAVVAALPFFERLDARIKFFKILDQLPYSFSFLLLRTH
jgi:hypothetical protein